MTDKDVLAEWVPDDGFNLIDYRDFSGRKEVIPPPYLLSFRFPQEVVVGGVSVGVVGWSMPGCGAKDLFSRVVVTKNGNEVLYEGRLEPTMRLRQETRLTGKDDIRVLMFPSCPAHMARVNVVSFLSPRQAKDQDEQQPSKEADDNKPSAPQQQPPLPPRDDYWYLYATVVVMFLILMMTVLFMVMRPQKARR